jgi:DNA repair protein RecN (Recombination protein N)
MLIELGVRDLGVIAEARIPLQGGMTALTGETGAGKTMVVEALRLLSGGKAEPATVRQGAQEAVVEALFVLEETEWVIRRVVPAAGRSRSYLNGELVAANQLAELAAGLLEIHGQHSQQALMDRRHQREALDRFAGADTQPLATARSAVSRLRSELAELGGDERARQRQLDLLEHQLGEIESVAPSVGEDDELAAEEDCLAGAVEYRCAAAEALELLGGESAASDKLAQAVAVLRDVGPFVETALRVRGLVEELADATADLRTVAEGIEPDEERLAEIRERRHALADLRRKYGDTIEEVLEYLDTARSELKSLREVDERRASVSSSLEEAVEELARRAGELGVQRRAAAPELAGEVAAVLGDLALGSALLEVSVQDTAELPGAGEAVEIRLSTNPGMAPGPLSKVASGGELSRAMLALRLVLSGGPPTMVFDEVDAGIGGEAAVSVGRSLAALGRERQVIVVTHLPQVAAFADTQVLVHKGVSGDSTFTTTKVLSQSERVVELSRMLSGSPDSEAARRHAEELLAEASSVRVGSAASRFSEQ